MSEPDNVRWTEGGRVAVVEIEIAGEMYDELMAGWRPVRYVGLAQLRGHVVLLFNDAATPPAGAPGDSFRSGG
jgi:glucan biosynthesis protein